LILLNCKILHSNGLKKTRQTIVLNCELDGNQFLQIDREDALDTLTEIASNHFVARRAMMLRMAERAA